MKRLTLFPALALWLPGLALAGAAMAAATAPAAASRTLKIATWNLDWLLAPATFNELAKRCTRADATRRPQRSIPCDVAADLERSASDFATLARRARELDADVVALQEVDGPSAARLVFRDHEFCFSASAVVQNTGFAIRRGVPFRCAQDWKSLSMGDSLRRGAVVVLYPDTPNELWLMDVHLKSGCARGLLDRDEEACRKLGRQVPHLESWIDAQARSAHRFVVLGDFNRDLLHEQGAARDEQGRQRNLWAEIDDGEPANLQLFDSAVNQRFANCTPGQAHNGFIDYIVLGGGAKTRWIPGSFEQLTWSARDAWRRTLSDHCPIAVRLKLW
ncbi:MAG: endonuclease/exonuclease/phosphatase family protein [Steroidobacteraceae bacterium]